MEDNIKEVSDKKLEKVNGGVATRMECTYCSKYHNVMYWEGDYEGKGPYICPLCGNKTLYGKKIDG